MLFTDLPLDIIILLFPYLDAKDFLALSSSIPSLLPLRQESSYWRALTRSTFRIPPQPLLEADGAHWQRLYRTLRTQTQVYTWGSNSRGNLGHYDPPRKPSMRFPRARRNSGWPQELHDNNRDKIGVVADVQCGGWSTVLLNSTGQLFSLGVMNGQVEINTQGLTQLSFPPAYPPTSASRYEPSTAVKQFSVGRLRALALSDDGGIWEWSSFQSHAQLVKFWTLDSDATRSTNGEGKVTKVVAGWGGSSAYVTGTGIVYWTTQPENDETSPYHAFMVHHNTVPGTAYRRTHPSRQASDSVDASIGEVIEYVLLDNYIVFITHLHKLFAYPTNEPERTAHLNPVELTQFYQDEPPAVKSVQGSFLKFGVFLTNGAVLIGTKDLLDQAWAAHAAPLDDPTPRDSTIHAPLILPSLQSSSVISLAFGDHHFHALRADGHITSHGTESGACGSLGLGDHSISHLRGVFFARRNTGDGQLLTPQWGDGRRTVWFEDEKQQWLVDTCQKGATNEANPRALRVAEDPETAKLVGEWFEREGRDWAAGPVNTGVRGEVNSDGNEGDDGADGVHPFFCLKIAAAGHSSAALVLVNDEKRERVRRKYVVTQPDLPTVLEAFPSDGSAGPPTQQQQQAEQSQPEQQPQPRSPQQQQQPDAPSLLTTAANSVNDLGRWMLGLDARDAREAAERQRQQSRPKQVEPWLRPELSRSERRRALREEINYHSTYVWEQQAFPRLRYPDGRVMPGEVEVTGWKGGEPQFEGGEA